MNINVLKSVPQIVDHWHDEDRSLAACVEQVRQWMREVEQRGIPHFGETAARLSPLRERLLQHFEREDKMLHQIAELFLTPTPAIDAVRTQALHEHDQLLFALDELRGRLSRLQPPFVSWQAAMREVEEFFHSLERHEEQEAVNVQALMVIRAQHEQHEQPLE